MLLFKEDKKFMLIIVGFFLFLLSFVVFLLKCLDEL